MYKKLVAFACLAAVQLQAREHCCNSDSYRLPAPELTSAVNNNGTITVSGYFKSRNHGDSNFIIQFFGNPANRAGVTEGQDFLGQTTVRTSCTGRAKFTVTLPPTTINDPYMSATATLVTSEKGCHKSGRFFSQPVETSMFSSNIAIS